jgi:plasmid stabilization system protein ParE
MRVAYRVVIMPSAESEIENAYQWMLTYQPPRATEWIRGLFETISSLSDMPARCGIAYESRFFHKEVRQLLFGTGRDGYRILFVIDNDEVQVLYVRHNAQAPIEIM